MSTETIEKLQSLVETAREKRLAPAEEEQATALIKELVLAGKTAVVPALDASLALPWLVGVRGIEQAWPELSPTARKSFITAINKQESEAGRRFRLSLARGIHKQDTAGALKLAVAVCEEIKGGGFNPKDRQGFFNAFIGRGKPWVSQLDLSELKPTEADAMVQCAMASCFPHGCPPPAQLALVRWAVAAGRLSKVPDEMLQSLLAAISKWKVGLREELKQAVPELAQLLPEPAPVREQKQQEQEDAAAPAQPAPAQRAPRHEPRPPHQARATREPISVNDAIRAIESQFASLRAELDRAKREGRGDPRDRRRQRSIGPEPDQEQGEDGETLRRHNARLEETVAELRAQIEDLVKDHEDRSETIEIEGEAAQLRKLLGIKLGSSYAEFNALEKAPPDEVFREHYRMLIAGVFRILSENGIAFIEPPAEEIRSKQMTV